MDLGDLLCISYAFYGPSNANPDSQVHMIKNQKPLLHYCNSLLQSIRCAEPCRLAYASKSQGSSAKQYDRKGVCVHLRSLQLFQKTLTSRCVYTYMDLGDLLCASCTFYKHALRAICCSISAAYAEVLLRPLRQAWIVSTHNDRRTGAYPKNQLWRTRQAQGRRADPATSVGRHGGELC